jgi:imidazolonepropionase-like amidohydrolase
VFADNEDEARKDVQNYARLGYVQIKVYSSLKPELVPKIAQMAHSHGMRLSGHVPAGMTAADFVRAGADEVQHMNFILLNFMPQVKDTRTPARFTEVAAHAAEIDLSSEQVQAFIHLLQERKTVVDPTVSIFEDMFTDRAGQMPAGWADVAERMPSEVRRSFLYGGLELPQENAAPSEPGSPNSDALAKAKSLGHDMNPGAGTVQEPVNWDQRYRDSFRAMLKMTRALYDAGVPIVAGTDSTAGFALHRELELYVEAGIPAPKVLQLATLGAARVMKRDAQLGSISPGKLADVILVKGDPSQSIKDIDRIETVVKDGVVYQVSDLDKAIGVRPM